MSLFPTDCLIYTFLPENSKFDAQSFQKYFVWASYFLILNYLCILFSKIKKLKDLSKIIILDDHIDANGKKLSYNLQLKIVYD